MKKNVLLILTTFLSGIIFAAGAFGAGITTTSADPSLSDQANQVALHSASKFIGTEVRDVNGKEIGEVKDLQIDLQHGITYAVVENDKLTQIDKRFLVPLTAFNMSHETDYVSLPIAKENMASYPKFDKSMDQETYGRNLHQFYGVSYPWGDLQK